MSLQEDITTWQSFADQEITSLRKELSARDTLLRRAMLFARSVSCDMGHGPHMPPCECTECAIYNDSVALVADIHKALEGGK